METASDLPFELDSLARAENYQKWIFETIQPYLGERILEIGAGIGNMSKWLPIRERLIVSERDPNLIQQFNHAEQNSALLSNSRSSVIQFDLTRDDLNILKKENLDTIISFNVLEHIENDREVLQKLVCILENPNQKNIKKIITFVPAHQWAYGSFDKNYGHFRRYSAEGLDALLKTVVPVHAKTTFQYFNLVGLLGWLVSGKILSKQIIDPTSIYLFDRLCPYIKGVDQWIHRSLKVPIGQSLLAVTEWN